jgi:hypothetical protein
VNGSGVSTFDFSSKGVDSIGIERDATSGLELQIPVVVRGCFVDNLETIFLTERGGKGIRLPIREGAERSKVSGSIHDDFGLKANGTARKEGEEREPQRRE